MKRKKHKQINKIAIAFCFSNREKIPFFHLQHSNVIYVCFVDVIVRKYIEHMSMNFHCINGKVFIIDLIIDPHLIYAWFPKPKTVAMRSMHIKNFEGIFELLISWGMLFNDVKQMFKYGLFPFSAKVRERERHRRNREER